jgi:hypothetical protein
VATLALGLGGLGLSAGMDVFSTIAAHHNQAVAKEAQNLNAAVPAFMQQLQQIVAAVNAGQLSKTDAVTYIDLAVDDYYSQVSQIMQGDRNCTGGGKCNHSGTCNGPCCVGCDVIQPFADAVKSILTGSGQPKHYRVSYLSGGKVQLGPVDSHAGFNGYPAFILSLVAAPQTQINTLTLRHDSTIPETNNMRQDLINPNSASFGNSNVVGSLFGDPGYRTPVYGQVIPSGIAVDSSNDRATGNTPPPYNQPIPSSITNPEPVSAASYATPTQPNYMKWILILLAVLAVVTVVKGGL